MDDTSHSAIPCPLRQAALEAPDAAAIIGPERTLTYQELDGWVSSAALEFRKRGLEKRRVGMLLDRSWRAVALLLAAIRAGAVACPLSTRLPAAGIEERLKRVDAAAFVSELDTSDAIHPSALLTDPELGEPSRGHRARSLEHMVPDGQPATIIFTSGSTGAARAALHTFGNHFFSAAGSNENIPLGTEDRWLLSLPMYHVGGLAIIFRCVLARAAILIPGPDDPLPELVARATHVSMVATQLRRLLTVRDERHGRDVSHLRALLLGGGAIPNALIRESHAQGLPIHTSYGLTEMASQVTTTPPGAEPDVLFTSGSVLPHREIRIDESGEILVRGATRFEGYVEGNALQRPFDAGGWFRTGDLGSIDDGGRLHVTGRKDNMFISGGENIQPETIESVLTALPHIGEAVVVPVADDEFGQRPVAFVRAAGGRWHVDELRTAIAQALPRFMIPVAFHDLPAENTQTGIKVDREQLRLQAEHMRRS